MGSGVSTENMTDEQYKEAVDKLFAEVASIRESIQEIVALNI